MKNTEKSFHFSLQPQIPNYPIFHTENSHEHAKTYSYKISTNVHYTQSESRKKSRKSNVRSIHLISPTRIMESKCYLVSGQEVRFFFRIRTRQRFHSHSAAHSRNKVPCQQSDEIPRKNQKPIEASANASKKSSRKPYTRTPSISCAAKISYRAGKKRERALKASAKRDRDEGRECDCEVLRKSGIEIADLWKRDWGGRFEYVLNMS